MNPSTEPTRRVVIEKRFAHAPEKLWRALTEPALLTQWLLRNDFAPEIGREFQFRNEPVGGWDGVIECKVLLVEPLQRLTYSWRAFGQETTVEFMLTLAEGGTLLRMEHSGFQADQKAAYQGAAWLAEVLRQLGTSARRGGSMTKLKAVGMAFWIVTALLCVEMIFTAYWEWFTPDAAHAFARLGFPAASFRVELPVAKMLGVLALLTPAIPMRAKEWAYAGFAFNLVSALVAHTSIHDPPAAFAPSTITLLLAAGSYLLWRRLESLRRSPISSKPSQSADSLRDAESAMREPTGGCTT